MDGLPTSNLGSLVKGFSLPRGLLFALLPVLVLYTGKNGAGQVFTHCGCKILSHLIESLANISW